MKKQEGGVSIVVVMFAAVLFVAITIGFTVLMLRDQERATDSDLAQSAYDSAQAGVADAKRLYNTYLKCKLKTAGASSVTPQTGIKPVNCSQIISQIEKSPSDQNCNLVGKYTENTPDNKETIIKQSTGDEKLEQAYTCVKINSNTPDVKKVIHNEGDIKIIPLIAKEGDSAPVGPSDKGYYKIEVLWSENNDDGSDSVKGVGVNDMKDAIGVDRINTNAAVDAVQLPKRNKWKPEFGSILRVQTISYNPSNTDLKNQDLDNQVRSVFLYPTKKSDPAALNYSKSTGKPEPINLTYKKIHTADPVDSHKPLPEGNYTDQDDSDLDAKYNYPRKVACVDSKATADEYNKSTGTAYRCKAEIYVNPLDSNDITYLTLSGVYIPASGGLNVAVRMIKKEGGEDKVSLFKGIQPSIDSTGRANNLYRRIVSRVDTPITNENSMPLPRAALGVRGDLCKAFIISDNIGGFGEKNGGLCSDVDIKTNPN